MSKHINPNYFYNLPSGAKVHPCRLIQKGWHVDVEARSAVQQ